MKHARPGPVDGPGGRETRASRRQAEDRFNPQDSTRRNDWCEAIVPGCQPMRPKYTTGGGTFALTVGVGEDAMPWPCICERRSRGSGDRGIDKQDDQRVLRPRTLRPGRRRRSPTTPRW